MYSDRTLIPTEVIRLCALGTLTLAPMTYAELAREVRAFTGRLSGPTLDMMGTSIELLRTEGLIEAIATTDPDAEATLRLTPAGEAELRDLLSANLRNTLDDLSRLVFALKLRFLHVLAPAAAREQIDRLIDISNADQARRTDTKARYGHEPGGWASVGYAERHHGSRTVFLARPQDGRRERGLVR